METKKEDTTMEDLRATVKQLGECRRPYGHQYNRIFNSAYRELMPLAAHYAPKAIYPYNQDSSAVEDAVLDTIRRLRRKQMNDKTFADRICKSTIFNILRSTAGAYKQRMYNGARAVVLLETECETDDGYSCIDNAVADYISQEEEVEQKDLLDILHRELNRLKENSPELYAVVKESQQGLGTKTFSEIGEKYGYSDQTASNRFKAGINFLREGFSR